MNSSNSTGTGPDMMPALREYLACLRVANNMSQVRFGKLLGVTDRTITSFESGRSRLNPTALMRAAAYFQPTPDEMEQLVRPGATAELGRALAEKRLATEQAASDGSEDLDSELQQIYAVLSRDPQLLARWLGAGQALVDQARDRYAAPAWTGDIRSSHKTRMVRRRTG